MLSSFNEFYKLPVEERLAIVAQTAHLKPNEAEAIHASGGLSLQQANMMIENVIGTMELPLGIAMHFVVNNKPYLIPMSLEEPSVVAGASKLAKIAKQKGGFTTSSTEPIMISQIQITKVADPFGAKMRILAQRERILQLANAQDPILVKAGGGAVDIEVRVLDTARGPMVICHLLVNCQNAMGANAVNTMAEALAAELETISGGEVCLRIISNLAVRRLARAYAVFDKEMLGGEWVVDRIIDAYCFADSDPFRATTHNKGIMNGVIAVALATGQDTRALEAGAHAYASMSGRYRSLSTWEKNRNGDLVGTLEMPMAVGIIGGITKVHPIVQACLHIIGAQNANELGQIMAAVGLAQNAAALRALADEGIQQGHMSLHARNMAVVAGAPTDMVDTVVSRLVASGHVRLDQAQNIVKELLREKEKVKEAVNQ
jgi:hydroxymethylglutaryl-CoA reductase